MVNIYKLWQDGQRKDSWNIPGETRRAWTQGSGVPGREITPTDAAERNAVIPSPPLPSRPEAAVLLGRVLPLDSSRVSSSVAECIPPDSLVCLFVFNKAFYNTKIIIWRVVQKSQCDFQKNHKCNFRWTGRDNWFNCKKKNPIKQNRTLMYSLMKKNMESWGIRTCQFCGICCMWEPNCWKSLTVLYEAPFLLLVSVSGLTEGSWWEVLITGVIRNWSVYQIRSFLKIEVMFYAFSGQQSAWLMVGTQWSVTEK